MKVLITGGHGTLGSKLKGYFPNALTPTKDEWDIQNPIFDLDVDIVIHCAAIKTSQCDKNKNQAMNVNILGTANIANFCHRKNAKLVYISTDYVFKGDKGNYRPDDEVYPVNYYAETKLAGEYVVKSLENYLIIRLSFYPDIFPYPEAFTDQYTTRLTVSEAAEQIYKHIDQTGICHIAGKKQSVYEFALQTSGGKEIKPISMLNDPFKRPKDTSLLPHLDAENVAILGQ